MFEILYLYLAAEFIIITEKISSVNSLLMNIPRCSYQQGEAPDTPAPELHDQHAANQNAPAAQPANQPAAPERNQPMVMNAAGEAVMDDDDDENANRLGYIGLKLYEAQPGLLS